MAVDAADDIVIVDELGYINKFRLGNDGNVTLLWSKKLSNTSFNTSIVIDGFNDYYAGTDNGRIVKLSGTTGDTMWTYNSSSSITATPALSGYGTIYFGNQNGEVYSLQTETGVKNWYFKLDVQSAISSHLLHINGATYFTTATTKKIYQLWDRPTGFANSASAKRLITVSSNVVNASEINMVPPIWSSFQGDYRRTGHSTKTTSIFTFNGSGNWNASSNWDNTTVPPYVVPAGHIIIIDPSGNGECIIDQPIILNAGSSLEVKPGKKLLLRK
jgi:outer membrane protein assembly factor BamB